MQRDTKLWMDSSVLSAIHGFFSGDYSLSGLRVLSPLNGLRYTKCPPKVKRTLDRASISAIVLLMESKSQRSGNGPAALSDIRRLVFDRLNTGGRRLNAQEIRNALNPGPLNRTLIEISRFSTFTEVFGIPPYTEEDEGDNPLRESDAPKEHSVFLYARLRASITVFCTAGPEKYPRLNAVNVGSRYGNATS